MPSSRILLLTTMSFLVGMSQFVITGILDQVAASVGVSVAAAGQLITAFSLANAFGTPVIMVLAARADRRILLLGGLAAIVAGLLVSAFVPTFAFLLVGRILIGLGAGVYGVSSFVIAVSLAPPGKQATTTSNLSMGYSASLIVGVPLGRLAAAAFGWPAIFAVVGFLGAAALAAAFRWIPPTQAAAPVPLRRQAAFLTEPRILVCLAAAFTMFVGYSAGNTYVTPLLKHLVPLDNQGMSLILLAIGIMSVLGSKTGGMLADRFGVIPTLLGGLGVQALAMALVLPAAGWVPASLGLILLWSGAAWTCGPILNLNLARMAPEATGILLSLNSTAVQLGFAAGAALGGWGIAAQGSAAAVPWIGAVSAAGAAGLIVWFAVGYSGPHAHPRRR